MGGLLAVVAAGGAAAQDLGVDVDDLLDAGGGDDVFDEFVEELDRRRQSNADEELTITIEEPTSWTYLAGDDDAFTDENGGKRVAGSVVSFSLEESTGVVRDIEFAGEPVAEFAAMGVSDVEEVTLESDVFMVEGDSGILAIEDADPMHVSFVAERDNAQGVIVLDDDFEVDQEGTTVTLRSDDLSGVLAVELDEGALTVDDHTVRIDLVNGGEAVLELER